MHTFGADEPYVKWHTILNGAWMVSSAKNSASPGTKSSRTRALCWACLAPTPGDSLLKHGYNFTVFTHTSCGKGVTIWCLIVLDMFLAAALYPILKKGGGAGGDKYRYICCLEFGVWQGGTAEGCPETDCPLKAETGWLPSWVFPLFSLHCLSLRAVGVGVLVWRWICLPALTEMGVLLFTEEELARTSRELYY